MDARNISLMFPYGNMRIGGNFSERNFVREIQPFKQKREREERKTKR